MEQVLFIIGASIFGLLGSIHLVLTFLTNKFEAFDVKTTQAMKNTTPLLTKETTVWDAWIGFNASHSLGAIIVAAFYVPLAVSHFYIIQQSIWFSTLPAFIGLAYIHLANSYWFKVPFIGFLISTACLSVAAILVNF